MADLEEKLEREFGEYFGEDPEYGLDVEMSERNSATAFLTSSAFDGLDEYERQERVWDVLESEFDEEEQARINIVIANTPRETEAMFDEDNGPNVEDLEEKLETAFREVFDRSSALELDDIGDDRFAGSLISGSFAGKTEAERQNMVWDVIDEHLPPWERNHIVSIRTLTPEENRRASQAS